MAKYKFGLKYSTTNHITNHRSKDVQRARTIPTTVSQVQQKFPDTRTVLNFSMYYSTLKYVYTCSCIQAVHTFVHTFAVSTPPACNPIQSDPIWFVATPTKIKRMLGGLVWSPHSRSEAKQLYVTIARSQSMQRSARQRIASTVPSSKNNFARSAERSAESTGQTSCVLQFAFLHPQLAGTTRASTHLAQPFSSSAAKEH